MRIFGFFLSYFFYGFYGFYRKRGGVVTRISESSICCIRESEYVFIAGQKQ